MHAVICRLCILKFRQCVFISVDVYLIRFLELICGGSRVVFSPIFRFIPCVFSTRAAHRSATSPLFTRIKFPIPVVNGMSALTRGQVDQ